MMSREMLGAVQELGRVPRLDVAGSDGACSHGLQAASSALDPKGMAPFRLSEPNFFFASGGWGGHPPSQSPPRSLRSRPVCRFAGHRVRMDFSGRVTNTRNGRHFTAQEARFVNLGRISISIANQTHFVYLFLFVFCYNISITSIILRRTSISSPH